MVAKVSIGLDEARALDAADPLRAFRDRFVVPEGLDYLDGNSLGVLPKATAPRQRDLVEREWGERLIRSWNEAGWIEAPQRIGAKIASLIGARPHEVIVADSTSVNLYKLLVAAARLSDRPVLLSEAGNFEVLAAFGGLLLAVTMVFVGIGMKLAGRDFMLRRN